MNDNEIRARLESLDTLHSGVVYGKEEAWEKLQGRLDAKPARRISLKYGLAAAAVLLLAVLVTGVFYRPAKEITVKQQNDTTVPNKAAIMTTMPSITQQTVTESQPKPIINIRKHSQRHPQKTEIVKHVPQEQLPAPLAANSPLKENAVLPAKEEPVAVPAPIVTKQPMKVVHINDLERGVTERTTALAGSAPDIDIKKLPVVHIRDVEKEAIEINKLLKEKRLTIHSFIKLEDNNDQQAEEYYKIQNPLKNIFASQND